MDNTLTLRSTTRWDGQTRMAGTVLRVPQDVDITSARRWINKGIATIGGEYIGNQTAVAAPTEIPFREIEAQFEDAKALAMEELMQNNKQKLIDICTQELVMIDPRQKKEDIAKAIWENRQSQED